MYGRSVSTYPFPSSIIRIIIAGGGKKPLANYRETSRISFDERRHY